MIIPVFYLKQGFIFFLKKKDYLVLQPEIYNVIIIYTGSLRSEMLLNEI